MGLFILARVQIFHRGFVLRQRLLALHHPRASETSHPANIFGFFRRRTFLRRSGRLVVEADLLILGHGFLVLARWKKRTRVLLRELYGLRPAGWVNPRASPAGLLRRPCLHIQHGVQCRVVIHLQLPVKLEAPPSPPPHRPRARPGRQPARSSLLRPKRQPAARDSAHDGPCTRACPAPFLLPYERSSAPGSTAGR